MKKYKTRHEDDPLRILQEMEIWPYEQMLNAQLRISPGERDAETHLGV